MTSFWRNKRVGVTGANGFIGSEVVAQLIPRGAQVTAFVSPQTSKVLQKKTVLLTKNVVVVPVDLKSLKQTTVAFAGLDIILHFAALDGGLAFKKLYPEKIYRVNTKLVKNVLAASIATGVRRVLIVSSTDVYPQTASGLVTETLGWSSDKGRKIGYVWAKRIGEKLAKSAWIIHRLPVAIARLGNVYGPGDSPDRGRVIPTFISQALTGNAISIPAIDTSKRSFLYVTDAARAILDLTENYACADPVNIVSSNFVTLRGLARKIIKLTKSQSELKLLKDQWVKSNRIISSQKACDVIRFTERVDFNTGLKTIIQVAKRQMSLNK